jgi:hypothetical protein
VLILPLGRGILLPSTPDNISKHGWIWPAVNAATFLTPSFFLVFFLGFFNWRALVNGCSTAALTLTAAYVIFGSGFLVLSYGKLVYISWYISFPLTVSGSVSLCTKILSIFPAHGDNFRPSQATALSLEPHDSAKETTNQPFKFYHLYNGTG